jgi:enterochelin esterase-like enzyme
VWLESLGDWAWPGRAAPAEALPPPWVPALPARGEPALAGVGAPARGAPQLRLRPRRVLATGVLSALVAACGVAALSGPATLERILGARAGAPALPPAASATAAAGPPAAPLPALVPLRRDAAGSSIEKVSFASASLAGRGAFLVYLPPGYDTGPQARYPVLYLLHGRNGHASAFLEIGIQRTLDEEIAHHAIAPLIAVMIQDRPGLQNWSNVGWRHSESYVVEVQQLVDRMLRTIAARGGRAIAGSSMGGYGAMHVALANPLRFSVVESWLGFFDGLGAELRSAAPVISRLGLHAFLYGAEADPVAVPEEDPAFAAELRAAGADAEGVIYPGGHSLGKVREHLAAGLLYAARSLADAARREATEEARARWRG